IGVIGESSAGTSTLIRHFQKQYEEKGLTVAVLGSDAFLYAGRDFRYEQVGGSRNVYLQGPQIYNERALYQAILRVKYGKEKVSLSKELHVSDGEDRDEETFDPPYHVIIIDSPYMGINEEIRKELDLLIGVVFEDDKVRLERRIDRDTLTKEEDGDRLFDAEYVINETAKKKFYEINHCMRLVIENNADIIWAQDTGRVLTRKKPSEKEGEEKDVEDTTIPEEDVDAEETPTVTVDPAIAGRRVNLKAFNDLLDPAKPYTGYGAWIILNTNEDERAAQEADFDMVFKGRVTAAGHPVMVLSIVLPNWDTEGTGLLGAEFVGYDEACKMAQTKYGLDLAKMWEDKEVSIANILNAGSGKRCSALTQSENNARGSIKMFGTIKTAQGEVPLTLLLTVALQNAVYANSSQGDDIDTIYASQVYFGNRDVRDVNPSRTLFTKFAQGIEVPEDIKTIDLRDLGMFVSDDKSRIVDSMPKGTFAHEDEARKWFATVAGAAYSCGSHRIKRRMFMALKAFYREEVARVGRIEREPPDIIKPFVVMMKGLTEAGNVQARGLNSVEEVKAVMTKDRVAELEKIGTHDEVIRFFLINRGLADDIADWIGVFSIGNKPYWWRYRRPLELTNGTLKMLSDVSGKVVQLGQQGELETTEASEEDVIEALDMRSLREIEGPISKSVIGGVYVEGGEYSYEEVKAGVTIGGVYVKGSLINNSIIEEGSRIVNSVVEAARGVVEAEHSYVENVQGMGVKAVQALAYNLINKEQLEVIRRSVMGVFRARDDIDGGQAVVYVDFDTDGKEAEKIVLRDNAHT
ncbi:MAG: hypothetical protein GY861_24595, partial [bacterium]|nr:hypothetical protein [bacterium]